jgi:hypothetical protein
MNPDPETLLREFQELTRIGSRISLAGFLAPRRRSEERIEERGF